MKSNNTLFGVLVLIVVFITAAITHLYDKNTCLSEPELIENTDSISSQQEEVSISDYISLRDIMREQAHAEKVFMELEDVIIIDILNNFGTDISINDIVSIYEGNKETYDKVVAGAEIQKQLQNIINPKNKEETEPQDSITKAV